MTPEQIQNHRRELGLGRVEFGRAIGLGGSADTIRNLVEKYERDPSKKSHRPFPPKYELQLLKLIESSTP